MAKEIYTPFHSELQNREEASIAHGALTNSKRSSCFVKGVYPSHFEKQQGCYSWDSKGNKYVDFVSGLGSNILGFCHEEVNKAITDQLRKGITFSLATEMEIKTAEKVKECFPWVDKVRFLKTGSEACSAALRIARAKTKFDEVYSDGYHGFHDEFTSLTPPAVGVPFSTKFSIQKGVYPPAGTAALIVEPILTDSSPKRMEELTVMRKRCDETGTVLIYDEIITGFRYPKFGVSNVANHYPDLVCLGKAIANGMPLSVVAGKKEIMECADYFVSSTFAGETLSLAAAYKTMSLLQTKYDLNYLWDKGAQFLFQFNQIWSEGIRIEGYPTRGVFCGDLLTKALFWQESVKAGIFFGPSLFFNFSHIDVMDQVLSSCASIMGRIRTGSVTLEGSLPEAPYSMKARTKS